MNWRTVCVSYHDTSTMDDLILDGVRPAFAELSGAAYFLRHWRRGPHLRLNILATEEELQATVLPVLQRTIGGYLRAHPSTAAMDLAVLLPEHRRLAAAERDRGPLWPPRPDNRLELEPYDSRADVLGGEPGAELIADVYSATTAAAFGALDAMRTERQRLWTAFDLMVATAHAFCPSGLPLGYVSYRAHAETYLVDLAQQQRMRAEWERINDEVRPALHARLADIVSTDARSGPPGEWIAALAGVSERCFAVLDTGALRMDDYEFGMRPPPQASPFVRELMTNRDFHDRVLPSAPFRHYRLLLNLLYLQLTRLGVRPAERYLLGYLVANTVEEAYGVDAITQLRTNSAKTAAR